MTEISDECGILEARAEGVSSVSTSKEGLKKMKPLHQGTALGWCFSSHVPLEVPQELLQHRRGNQVGLPLPFQPEQLYFHFRVLSLPPTRS